TDAKELPLPCRWREKGFDQSRDPLVENSQPESCVPRQESQLQEPSDSPVGDGKATEYLRRPMRENWSEYRVMSPLDIGTNVRPVGSPIASTAQRCVVHSNLPNSHT